MADDDKDDPEKPRKPKHYDKNDDLPLKPQEAIRKNKSPRGTPSTKPKTAHQSPTLGAGSRVRNEERSTEQQERQATTPKPSDFKICEGGLLKDVHKPSAAAPPQKPQPVDLGDDFVDRLHEQERLKQASLNPPLKEPDHVFKDGDPLAQSKKADLRRTAPEVEKEFRRTDPQDVVTQFNTIKGKDVRKEFNKIEGHDLRWQFSKGGRGIDR